MHGPKLVLVLGAMSGFRCFKGEWMQPFQWQIKDCVANLVGLDIGLMNLWKRLTDEFATKGSLIVRKFNQGQLGGLRPLGGSFLEFKNHPFDLGRWTLATRSL